MILYIDTTDFNKATFAVSDGGKIAKKSFKIDPHRSHETLGKLDEFLRSQGINTTSPLIPPLKRGGRDTLSKIVVNKGPGGYTGVRVGVTMAMALGFAWGIPVKAIAKEKFKIT